MSEEQRHAAAMSDPDNLPLTDEDIAHGLSKPPVQLIREGLGLTREDFSKRYDIPLPTLRAWEEGSLVPDQPARRRLHAISFELAQAQAAPELR